MPLTRADLTKTRKFEDGESWLVLRTQLTKHDADVVAELNNNFRVDAGALAGVVDADRSVELRSRLVDTNRTLFALLVVEWSAGDNPTASDYDVLDEDSGAWVDKCISEVLVERRKRAEKNVTTDDETPKGSGGSSPEEDAPTPDNSPTPTTS